MQKTLTTLLLFLLTAGVIMAQDLYPAKFPNGKYGYIDKKGKTKVEPIFDSANDFYQGFAIVKSNEKFGFIDSTGKSVADFSCDDINDWELFEGYGFRFYAFRFGEFWGIVNYNGVVFKEAQYQKDFEDMRNATLRGLETNSSNYGAFSNTYNKLKWIISDSLSKIIPEMKNIRERKYGKVSLVRNYKKEIEYYIDNNLVNLDFRNGYGYGLVKGGIGDKYGFVNMDGKWEIKPIYDDVLSFSVLGIAAVKKDKKWYYIDMDGKQICNSAFDSAGYFDFFDDLKPIAYLAVVKRNDSLLYLTDKGEIIMPIEGRNQYEFIKKYMRDDFGNQYLTRTVGLICDNKWVAFPTMHEDEFKDFAPIGNDGLIKYRRGKNFGFIDTNGKVFIEPKFRSVQDFRKGYFLVRLEGDSSGIINTKGEFILRTNLALLEYDPAYNYLIFSEEWTQGIADINGNIIIPAKYEYCSIIKDNIFEVMDKEYNRYWLNSDNIPILNDFTYKKYYSDNMIYVSNQNQYGFVNIKGEWIWGPQIKK